MIIRFLVKVVPGAKENKIQKDIEGNFKIWLTAKPEKGKANKALVEILAKYYKVSKSSVRIIEGEKSKNKTIEIYS